MNFQLIFCFFCTFLDPKRGRKCAQVADPSYNSIIKAADNLLIVYPLYTYVKTYCIYV